MTYNIREYKGSFTGNKGSEENAIVAIIMNLLNKQKYDSIDDVLNYNGHSLKNFLKNNNRDTIPLHYGQNIKDDDFKLIIQNFKKMVEEKLQFDKESVKTTNFEDKQYIKYGDKVIDNSHSARSIEEEMKYIQEENADYQSLNQQENTEKIMKEITDYRKHEVEFRDLDSINRDDLNKEDQRKVDTALIEQHISGENKQISLEENLTKNEENELKQFETENNVAKINSEEGSIETSINLLSDIDKDLLSDYEREIYTAALNYQLETNEVIRLDIKNNLIITPYDEVKEIITKDDMLVVNDERMFASEEKTNENQLEKDKVKVLKLEYPKAA